MAWCYVDPPQFTPPDVEVLSEIPSNVPNATGGVYSLHAWFFRPSTNTSCVLPPLIIMSHGFSCRKDFGLTETATHFKNEGFAVLTFDHLGFGGSGGEPRGLVDARQQAHNVKSIVSYAIQKLGAKIDASRIILWGTCFGAQSTLVAARELEQKCANVIGVVLQTPNLAPNDLRRAWRLSGHWLWPVWVLFRFLIDKITGKASIDFGDFECDLGTPRQGWCFLPGAPTISVICPQHALDTWAKHPVRVNVKEVARMTNLTTQLKSDFMELKTPMLCTAAAHEQAVGPGAQELRQWASCKKVGSVQVEEVPGEHFSVYPVVNRESLERIKPYMTTPETTYDEESFPASMRLMTAWLKTTSANSE